MGSVSLVAHEIGQRQMKESHDGASAFGWIPQLFYDLIGRVIPGAAVLASGRILLLEPGTVTDLLPAALTQQGPWLAAAYGIVSAYLTGTLLGAFGFYIWGKEWKQSPPKLHPTEPPKLDDYELLKSYAYDAIQLHDPSAGARLGKLAAERHLCRVLVVGYPVLGLVHIIMLAFGARTSSLWISLPLCVSVAGCALLFHRHLRIREDRLLVNVWHALDLAQKTGLKADSVNESNR
jgi:hypothetical protein